MSGRRERGLRSGKNISVGVEPATEDEEKGTFVVQRRGRRKTFPLDTENSLPDTQEETVTETRKTLRPRRRNSLYYDEVDRATSSIIKEMAPEAITTSSTRSKRHVEPSVVPRKSEPQRVPRGRPSKNPDPPCPKSAPRGRPKKNQNPNPPKIIATPAYSPLKNIPWIKTEPISTPPRDYSKENKEKSKKRKYKRETDDNTILGMELCKFDQQQQHKSRERYSEPGPSTSTSKCYTPETAHPYLVSDYLQAPKKYVSTGSLYGGYRAVASPPEKGEIRDPVKRSEVYRISIRLRNLLKLPKAHKWVCCEWFYSNIDKVLFGGDNDFQQCLKTNFPDLKTTMLTRAEWSYIRRLMGKPRRCSDSFFDEERLELNKRRQKIRMLQQRKYVDFQTSELPEEIPLQLTIGTEVSARIKDRVHDGLFLGKVDGVDLSNNTFRITFHRRGVGTLSVPDCDVLSVEPTETIPTSSFGLFPRRSNSNHSIISQVEKHRLFGPFEKTSVEMLGGFQIRRLISVVKLSKLLRGKREKILQLKELNVEGEKMRAYCKPFNTDYRLRYSRCVLDLESINEQLAIYLNDIQEYCRHIVTGVNAGQMVHSEDLYNECSTEAHVIVNTLNAKMDRYMSNNANSLSLISKLASLLLQVKKLVTKTRLPCELKSLKDTIADIKMSLVGTNVLLFQNQIEIPMNRIQAGICKQTSC